MKNRAAWVIVLGSLMTCVMIYAGSGWRPLDDNALKANKPDGIDPSRSTAADLPEQPLSTVSSPNDGDKPALAQSDALRQELRHLQNQIDELGAFQASLQHSVNEVQFKGKSQDELEMDSSQGQAQSMAQKVEQQELAIDAQLQRETIDQEWALETELALNEALASDELQGIELLATSCGSTLCKVELNVDPSLPPQEAMQKLALHRPWDGPTYFKLDEYGYTQIYFAREGHELPGMGE